MFKVKHETVKQLADFKYSDLEFNGIDEFKEGFEKEFMTMGYRIRLFEIGYKLRWKQRYLWDLIKADCNEDEKTADYYFKKYNSEKESVETLIQKYKQLEKIIEYDRFQQL